MRTIHKVVAIIIKDDSFLMVRKAGKDIWTSLGGKPEDGESEEQALLREIKEEINCDAVIVRKLGDFTDKAVFDDAIVKLAIFIVELRGTPQLIDPELEEFRFIPQDYQERGIKLAPSIQKQIIPALITQDLLKWK